MARITDVTNLSEVLDTTYEDREFKRGEIYYVDLDDVGYATPYIQNKTRPALVIQNNIGNSQSQTLIIALLTTADKKPYPFQYAINLNGRESKIMMEQIMTIPKNRMLQKFGELTPKQIIEADQALMYSLALSRLSFCNIANIEIVSMISERTKTSESIYFLFNLFYNNISKQEIRISLEDLQKFDNTITKDTDFDELKHKTDCCRGLNWLINNCEF
jgi:mRNA interferase MazF